MWVHMDSQRMSDLLKWISSRQPVPPTETQDWSVFLSATASQNNKCIKGVAQLIDGPDVGNSEKYVSLLI